MAFVAGPYGVGRVKNPAELQPLALVHQELRETLPSMTELQELAKADQAATQATKQFQDALSPDARLRKLVLDGRCNSGSWPLLSVLTDSKRQAFGGR